MNHKELFNGVWKVLLVAALVIASISLGMNIMRIRLEHRNAAEPSSPAAAQEEVAVINVLAAGRAYYGLYTENKDDYWSNFSGLAETVANYDLAAYSQQTLIGTEVPWQFAEAATGIGFNLIGLADPHVLAYGKAGIDSSMDYWLDNPDVLANGTFVSTDRRNLIPTIRTGEVTAAFLSFTDDMNHDIPEQEQYLVNVYDDEKSPAQVAKAAEQADVVIVEMWWDGEDGKLPTDRQRTIAKALADAGASVIIGNAPDAIQPAAWIDDTLIFYSMGTMISDSPEDENRLGVIGAVTITKTTLGSRKKVELTNPRVDLVLAVEDGTGGYRTALLRDLSPGEYDVSKIKTAEYMKILQLMDDSIRIGGLE
ncbi:MAG: CapA family protein [Solobacterium sp.]|nr:CapA family protein [Solobacterium sp.]